MTENKMRTFAMVTICAME